MAPRDTSVDDEVKALLEQADMPPGAPQAKQINADVHVGNAPQRPYWQIEDRLGALQGALSTPFEQLPAEAKAKRDSATGVWYREVPEHTGASVMKDGVLHFVMRSKRRPIARTQQEARASNADWWNGATWVRNGVKPEAEHPINIGTDATVADEYLVPASPAEQASARAEAEARLRTTPAIPEASAGMKVGVAKATPAEGKV